MGGRSFADEGRAMDPLLKKLAGFGLELLDLTEEKIRELVDEIVRRGDAREEDADVLAERIREHGRSVRESLHQAVAHQVSAAIGDRLDRLEARVAALEALLGQEKKG
jgi:polyhydroxyalkanoate synthesis regulator phasin